MSADGWDRQMTNLVYEHLTSAAKQQEIADKRHAELMRVHERGWRQVAESISKGLGEIAKAIRERR